MKYFLVTWNWRDYRINALITSEEKDLLDKYNEVEYEARDFRGYGNDETFTASDLNFREVPEEANKWFDELNAEENSDVVYSLLREIESHIERKRWDEE